MILYALACEAGHGFDSWFRDSAGYEEQAARGLVSCPVCRSVAVTKSIMSPALHGLRASSPSAAPPEPDAATPERDQAEQEPGPLLDAGQRALRDRVKAVRDTLLAESDDVGRRFPDEARRMHEGDIPHRRISGQATLEEARALVEDGIPVLPVPFPADRLN